MIAAKDPAQARKNRANARRNRTATGTLTHHQAAAARRQATSATQRRYQLAGRAPVATADPTLTDAPQIRTRLVRHAAAIVDADPTVVAWVTDKLEARHVRPGRPRELSVRTALICFILQTIVHKNFQLFHLPRLLATMTWRVQRELGIAYMRNGTPTQLSYSQLLDMFHDLADTFDAWGADLGELTDEPEQRAARAADLQELVDRMMPASNHAAPIWSGNGAMDATLKWSHERPPGAVLNSKIDRNGRDGDNGPPEALCNIAVDGDGELDRTQFGPIDPVAIATASAYAGLAKTAGRTKRKSSWPKTWSLGAAWVGRKNKAKGVHGYAWHTIVRSDGPCLIEGFTVTPANGDPVTSGLPILRRILDRRSQDPAVLAAVAAGDVFILGDIVADAAYTTREWMLKVKAMEASPIARLHKTNQQGLRYHDVGVGRRAGQIVTFAGRPVCECIAHTELADLRFPTYPYTTAQIVAYQSKLAKLDRFEWTPNGAVRPDGSRQYLAPHHGGCEHCTDENGQARLNDDGRARSRCCQAVSRRIPRDVIGLEQGDRFGSREWFARWNPRNRVEGSYGILKNLAIINYCRSFHSYVGLARETLITLFAAIAYNFHMLRSWKAREALASTKNPDDTFDPFGPLLPSAQPVAAAPAPPPAPKVKRTPRGMTFLGDRAGPDDPPA